MKTEKIAPHHIPKIIQSFKNTRILVVGDCMLDEYMWGDVNRISPEAPVPVVSVEETTVRLGGAANVAQNLDRLGITPVLVSVIGQDVTGQNVSALLSRNNCTDAFLCKSSTRPTTIKTRIMARQQQVVRADRERTTDLDDNELKDISAKFAQAIQDVKGVIISDYAKGVICPRFLKSIIAACRERDIFVAVDPKERHFDLYANVSVITPNLKETYTALGLPPERRPSDSAIKAMGWQLLDKLDLAYVLMTLSERGMGLFEKEQRKFTHLSTVAQEVYDVTGAGDTVISVFSAAMICGATPFEAAYMANHAAGITVAEIGTASVDAETLLQACLQEHGR